jgi:SAM-dependent methyltransferase
VIDIGGGDSRFVDVLLARGCQCLTVLDISSAALTRAKARLGPAQNRVTWLEADVIGAWPVPQVDVWHDRAVFHFFTDDADRAAYLAHLRRGLREGGTLILATFAPDGPEKCSGLPVVRYSPETLRAVLGPEFRLLESIEEAHPTPWNTRQAFSYTRWVRGHFDP